MPATEERVQSDGLQRNLMLFVLFRVFFNARFYYPIFTILFFDFGLSPTDFYLLNGVVWTLASISLEVPSGALADQVGRRALLIAAGVLMVLEMVVICATPADGAWGLVFAMFFINRILSGAAEAAASGADEALAYDSIPEEERETVWPKIQSKLIIFQSVGMIIALNLGAYGYDKIDIKFPLYLCLITSFITLFITLLFKEPPRDPAESDQTIRQSFARTLSAGKWILHNSAPFYIMLVLVLFDSMIRLFYTVVSSYYRVIEIDPKYFGLIGTGANLIGLAAAPVIGWMVANRSAAFNYRLASVLILLGLGGMALQIPIWGFLVLMPMGIGMRHIHMAASQYLNRVTDSAHRATVLSFRGLAMMLFYGLANMAAITQTRMMTTARDPELWEPKQGDEIIRQTSPYWWTWFVGVLVFLYLFRRLKYGKPINEIVGGNKEKAA